MEINSKNAELLAIDGNFLEGGGQILRISAALSAILNLPVRVFNVRAGRSSPGLRPQHLAGLHLIRDLTNGSLLGGEIGSTEVEFRPGPIIGGKFSVDIGTAGSITLTIQAVLPCLLFASQPSCVSLKGGTDVDLAPPFDYYSLVFAPLLAKFGAAFSCRLVRRGFYPKGGGQVQMSVEPVKKLKGVFLDQPLRLKRIRGVSFVAGTIPLRVAEEMCEAAEKRLRSAFPNMAIDISRFKEGQEKAIGNGVQIVLAGESEEGVCVGASALGKPRVAAPIVGRSAADELVEVAASCCLDQYAQDQMVLFMALADGVSRLLVGPLTKHTRTAIHVTSLMTKVEFRVIDRHTEPPTFIIECRGLGIINTDVN